MRLKIDIDGNMVAMTLAEFSMGERAVAAAMREAGAGLNTGWRVQIAVMANALLRRRRKFAKAKCLPGRRPSRFPVA